MTPMLISCNVGRRVVLVVQMPGITGLDQSIRVIHEARRGGEENLWPSRLCVEWRAEVSWVQPIASLALPLGGVFAAG